jgi:predicted TIM-barrel fold metal-dependent hydrolase
MPPNVFSLSFLLASALNPIATLAAYSIDSSFKFDVHSHVVPDFYRAALIDNNFPVRANTLYTDGFPVPAWDLDSHIAAMDTQGVNYSTISISAPGVSFYNDSCEAARMARKLNNAMWNYTQTHPTRLGAMCILPLPDIPNSLAEIRYCLDRLHFDGVGMYSNFGGLYMGDAALNPIFAALNNRSATIFVHPAKPGCGSVSLGHPDPMIEYPFESVRVMENMLLTGQRANYSAINIIIPHGGGAMPYLAARIAGMASLPFLGSLSAAATLAQFKGYFFDTASASSSIQLTAMNAFGGVSKILTGTDYPYVPSSQAVPALASIQANGNYTASQMALINSQNALSIFPKVAAKLGFAISS